MTAVPEVAEHLFAAPLDEFTAQRNALVAELKRNGKSDEAVSVKKLRKPRVPAWAVNQLARRERTNIRTLVETTHALATASGAQQMRELARTRHDVVDLLTGRARSILEEAGMTPTSGVLLEIAQTLQTATEVEQLEDLRRGVLTEPFTASGFGVAFTLAPDGAEPPPDDAPRADKERERLEALLADARTELAQAEGAEEEARARLQHAERDLASAVKEAETARRAVERAQTRLDRHRAD